MSATIRQAVPSDAAQWVELLQVHLGGDYPAKQVYKSDWIASQLEASDGNETWVAEDQGRLLASITLLAPLSQNSNPIINLGRNLNRPESYADGSALALLNKINDLATQRGDLQIVRVLATDNAQQILFEQLGYVCVGYQPAKHLRRMREGIFFYVRISQPKSFQRLPLTETPPQVSELAAYVLNRLGTQAPQAAHNGVTGYPLQSDLAFHECSFDDFDLWRMQAQAANPPVEISSGYNLGLGLLRLPSTALPRTLLGQREDQIVAGLAYAFDEHDRCVRIIDAFATDDISLGAMVHHAVKTAHEQLSAVYVETDVLLTATRLLKSAEQLGLVPVAYLPAFYWQGGRGTDVVKMVKLNLPYSQEKLSVTAQARSVAEIVDHNFTDHKVGVAIVNLLGSLPIFTGLGEGELRRIARLCTQKLYHPGDIIFRQGDHGNEAFVIMRGLIDIFIEHQNKAIATVRNGQIFGEQAFLDGAARGATAKASQASILLEIKRSAFTELVQHEPHLGMVVMRNIAIELSSKLRHTDALLVAPTH